MKIEVEKKEPKPGICVGAALVGNEHIFFEIYVSKSRSRTRTARRAPKARYYVNHVEVDAQTYRLALKTAELDRYCPQCKAVHVDHEPPEDDPDIGVGRVPDPGEHGPS